MLQGQGWMREVGNAWLQTAFTQEPGREKSQLELQKARTASSPASLLVQPGCYNTLPQQFLPHLLEATVVKIDVASLSVLRPRTEKGQGSSREPVFSVPDFLPKTRSYCLAGRERWYVFGCEHMCIKRWKPESICGIFLNHSHPSFMRREPDPGSHWLR